MDTIETLNERNKHFAAHQFTGELAMMPALRTMIIGCADPRSKPPPTCSASSSATLP